MTRITEADRQAAQELRVILADICGFWHQPGDDSPLCLALAKHRQAAEERLAEKLVPLFSASAAGPEPDTGAPPRPVAASRTAKVKLSA